MSADPPQGEKMDTLTRAFGVAAQDSPDQVAETQNRLRAFLDENNVSMMGGWT